MTIEQRLQKLMTGKRVFDEYDGFPSPEEVVLADAVILLMQKVAKQAKEIDGLRQEIRDLQLHTLKVGRQI